MPFEQRLTLTIAYLYEALGLNWVEHRSDDAILATINAILLEFV